MFKKNIFFIILFLFLINKSAFGSEINFGAEVATVAIDEVSYTRFIFFPQFKHKNFELEMKINMDFDKKFKLRDGEWETWQAVVNKLKKISYGKVGDKLLVTIGGFDKISIGHGTILHQFSNNAYAPTIQMQGLYFNLDTDFFGIEYFTENILDLDIHVARFFVKPLTKFNIKFLKGLNIGFTIATDDDDKHQVKSDKEKYKFTDNPESNPAVTLYGIDVELPLPSISILSWTFFWDYNVFNNKGESITVGLSGRIDKLFNWKYGFINSSKGYLDKYFDNYYLADRANKFTKLEDTRTGLMGMDFTIWQNFSIVGKNDLTVLIRYQASTRERAKFDFFLNIDRSMLFNRFEASFTYSKKNILNFEEVFTKKALDTMIKATFAIVISKKSSLVLFYTKTFIKNDMDNVVGQEATGVQTKINF